MPEVLRERVVLVDQEHHVFTGSLRENVAIAGPDADDARLLEALDAVDADWVREPPEGLDTLVGSGGADLDPARAQQVALARVVLLDPHTVVLDEATSLLDPRTARAAERSLAAVLAGRTVIASRTGCTRRTTRTGWRWWRTVGSPRSGRTTNSSPPVMRTRPCDPPGTARTEDPRTRARAGRRLPARAAGACAHSCGLRNSSRLPLLSKTWKRR